ncbi:ABC transporter permease [Gracilibacillus sp. Marseille-QA3620]
MNMFIMQSRTETIRIFRNPYYVFWSLMMPIAFYFVFTKIFAQDGADDNLYKAHFLMSMAAFSVMGTAIMNLGIRLVEERNHGWSLLLKVTPLSPFTYYLAKMVSQLMIQFFSIVLIFLVGGLFNSISLSIWEWVSASLWILFGSIPFLAIGLIIGTMKKVDTASGVSNLIYLSLAITGGMWMPMEVMPDFIQDVAVWLPGYNYGNGAWQIVRGETPEWKGILLLIGYSFLFMLLSNYIKKRQEAVG